jgi:hypothetical protein
MNDMAQTQMHIPPSNKPRTAPPQAGSSSQRRKGRSGWLTLTIIVWLLLVSALTATVVVRLDRFIQEERQHVQPGVQTEEMSSVLSTVKESIAQLTHRLETETKGLRESIQTNLEPVHTRQEESEVTLSSLAERLTGQAVEVGAEIASVIEKIKTLETRVASARESAAAPNASETVWHAPSEPRTSVSRPVPAVKPPFQVIGVEQRGGERFLTVIRGEGQSISDIELVRVGTRLGDWMLETIEEDAAHFRVGGGLIQLPIPRHPIVKGRT